MVRIVIAGHEDPPAVGRSGDGVQPLTAVDGGNAEVMVAIGQHAEAATGAGDGDVEVAIPRVEPDLVSTAQIAERGVQGARVGIDDPQAVGALREQVASAPNGYTRPATLRCERANAR